MLPSDGTDMTRDRSWLAALAVLKTAQQVFRPGNRPPGELMPLVEPIIRLRHALRARDAAATRRAAAELTLDDGIIAWGCRPEQPQEIREMAYCLAWLASTLTE